MEHDAWTPGDDQDEVAGSHQIAETQPKYVVDFVSGQRVRAGAEETQATQILSRRLVDEYGYPKSHIQTRPQFRVRQRPSDDKKSYPVDIAVFPHPRRLEDTLYIVAECKSKNRKTGIEQLKGYMNLSPATLGVWFNGADHAYLRKSHQPNGSITYSEIPNIPRFGERIEDVGLYRRRDLRKPTNLKSTFRDLRNHLAGNVTGMTRDEALAQEIINLLFCKIYDEINTAPEEMITFRSGVDERPAEVKKRLDDLFQRVKDEYDDVFEPGDRISIDSQNLVYVVGELQNYSVTEADRDAVGDAFEVFIGPALRGAEGQFFTPRNVVNMMVSILSPKPNELIIDPACGSGGFLIDALECVWQAIDEQGSRLGWSESQTQSRKTTVASKNFRGIEKDLFLAKVTKAYMAIVGDGRGGIFCDNSLLPPSGDDLPEDERWRPATAESIKLGGFDVVVTNPPFGKNIKIKGRHILEQFELGHKWTRDKTTGDLGRSSILHEDQPPQILFLERCLQLLKPGGRLGIVLPEAVFGMPTYEYVIAFLERRAKITGVVSMPEALFKTSGKGGTHAKVAVLFAENTISNSDDYDIFMADLKWCGHDSRGNPTVRIDGDGQAILLDEVPLVVDRYRSLLGQAN